MIKALVRDDSFSPSVNMASVYTTMYEICCFEFNSIKRKNKLLCKLKLSFYPGGFFFIFISADTFIRLLYY